MKKYLPQQYNFLGTKYLKMFAMVNIYLPFLECQDNWGLNYTKEKFV
jgi:hypothetical protein